MIEVDENQPNGLDGTLRHVATIGLDGGQRDVCGRGAFKGTLIGCFVFGGFHRLSLSRSFLWCIGGVFLFGKRVAIYGHLVVFASLSTNEACIVEYSDSFPVTRRRPFRTEQGRVAPNAFHPLHQRPTPARDGSVALKDGIRGGGAAPTWVRT